MDGVVLLPIPSRKKEKRRAIVADDGPSAMAVGTKKKRAA